MPPSNPLNRVPDRLRPLAYIAAGIALFVLAWLITIATRPEFGRLPDFASIEDVKEMKRSFYAYLTPIVRHHNTEITAQRDRLLALRDEQASSVALSRGDRRWLNKLAVQYKLETPAEITIDDLFKRLTARVDTIPLELALTQAAKESGWGRSRFAVEANNLFGQWCYDSGCGIVPSNRAAGATHEVREFSSVSEAVHRYMNNLNSHERYDDFRRLRQQLRQEGETVTGLALAEGLLYYSQRREAYVQDLKSMIGSYREFELDRVAP